MNDPSARSNARRQRRLKKVRQAVKTEFEEARRQLQQRADYLPLWDYFLDLLMRPLEPGRLQSAVDRPLVEHLCNQAPYELFHAMGVHPLRLGSGCFAAGRLAADRLPVLVCPMLKATLGMERIRGTSPASAPRVVPTTCDWVVKFPQMTAATAPETRFLELPHLRQSEKGQRRWLEEIYGLVRWLERQTGRKLKRRTLRASVAIFMQAWEALGQLIELRRKGLVAGVWFLVVANSFMLDSIESWTAKVRQVLDTVAAHGAVAAGKGVFLAGSPIVFPHFKLLQLIEAAGMTVCADDLCTSERIWPGAVCYDDTSIYGLLRALAERYHKACICPTFADNERRVNGILNTLRAHDIRGVVFHLLKGCHPFDIESFDLEKTLKERGYSFLKIETDYGPEDSRNIMTRLEAFGEI
jgi:benzoyl-CoA reductase/2-hydroxyglutaryl-CoA dehydratase subunit BcrC/BadD/HgdB